MKIYISSSWKNRERVRAFAQKLEEIGHEVYDFTNPKCRNCEEIPPEKFPDQFDPDIHDYSHYLNYGPWLEAVYENRKALDECDLIILLLPCGNDAHADWAYGVGRGKMSVVVGNPGRGERSPVHLWAQRILKDEREVYEIITDIDE